jgi:hypothetical protein
MANKMNAEVKKKWLAALRSGKYKQGKYTLRTEDNEFCCLGVLCEVARIEGVIPNPKHAIPKYDDKVRWLYGRGSVDERRYGTLPSEVAAWAELWDNPLLGEYSAADWNDSQGRSFEEIADLVEEHL